MNIGAAQKIGKLEAELEAAHTIINEAKAIIGEGWFAGGVTLAHAIRRKVTLLEQIRGTVDQSDQALAKAWEQQYNETYRALRTAQDELEACKREHAEALGRLVPQIESLETEVLKERAPRIVALEAALTEARAEVERLTRERDVAGNTLAGQVIKRADERTQLRALREAATEAAEKLEEFDPHVSSDQLEDYETTAWEEAQELRAVIGAEPEEEKAFGDRLQTIVDEAFGPFETLPNEALLTLLEQKLSEQRAEMTRLRNEVDDHDGKSCCKAYERLPLLTERLRERAVQWRKPRGSDLCQPTRNTLADELEAELFRIEAEE